MATVAEKIAANDRRATPEVERAADDVREKAKEAGTYAYNFQLMDDGSVLAVYVRQPGGEVSYQAFADAEATAGWHPMRPSDKLANIGGANGDEG